MQSKVQIASDPRKGSPAPPDFSPGAFRAIEKAAKRELFAPAAAIACVVIVFVIVFVIAILIRMAQEIL